MAADPSDAELSREAEIFARYLVGRPATPDLTERYRDGSRALFGDGGDPRELAAVAFVRRHPWSVGLLDAGAGLLRPGGLLRGKVLLMAAILETSPAFADEFLPRATPPLRLFAGLALQGARAALRAVAGVALYAAAARARA